MDQEEIKRAFEAMGNATINVAGDFVMEKNVNYNIEKVETGGIGIQVIDNGTGKGKPDEAANKINDEEQKEENPAKRFVEIVKKIMLKAEEDNGKEKILTARGNGGTYIHNVKGKEFCLVMDELLASHEQTIENYLGHVTAEKAVGLKFVAPFIGFVFDTHEYTGKNMSKTDFSKAFKFYYGQQTSAVSKMSDKHPSDEALQFYEMVREIMKRHQEND